MWTQIVKQNIASLFKKSRIVLTVLFSLEFSRVPSKVDWVIYGGKSDPLNEILDASGKSYFFLNIGFERINARLLIKSILARDRGIPLFDSYVMFSIRKLSPQGLITLYDNDRRFWRISGLFDEIVIVVVQNARRFYAFDVFGIPDLMLQNRGRFDHLLCHTAAISDLYLQHNDVENIQIVGSYKSNELPVVRKNEERKSVLWISSIEKYKGNEFFTSLRPEYEAIAYSDYNRSDELALGQVVNFCIQHDLPLKIAGRSTRDDNEEEILWFRTRTSSYEFDFISRDSWDTSYKEIDNSFLIATVDGTLGYEALTRKSRVAFFSHREIITQCPSNRFGWPKDFPLNGPFWTSDPTHKAFESVLANVFLMSDAEWELIVEKYSEHLMGSNPGNSVLRTILQDV
jgi:surface carbohydrate biosynthesis protein